MYLKAYGDSYSREYHYTAERTHSDNTFMFDEDISGDEADILFPTGLVKAGSYYPTSVFYYSDGTKPRKLHWVDKIELNIVKEYD